MKDESLGTNVCTAAADADEGHSDLADLHDFAETYLLESHHETKEFEVGPMRDLSSRRS